MPHYFILKLAPFVFPSFTIYFFLSLVVFLLQFPFSSLSFCSFFIPHPLCPKFICSVLITPIYFFNFYSIYSFCMLSFSHYYTILSFLCFWCHSLIVSFYLWSNLFFYLHSTNFSKLYWHDTHLQNIPSKTEFRIQVIDYQTCLKIIIIQHKDCRATFIHNSHPKPSHWHKIYQLISLLKRFIVIPSPKR